MPSVVGKHCDASPDADPEFRCVYDERLCKTDTAKAADHPPGVRLVLDRRHHNDEMVRRDASHLSSAREMLQAVGDLAQQSIANMPAERLVHRPQALDIEQCHGEPTLRTARRLDQLADAVDQ